MQTDWDDGGVVVCTESALCTEVKANGHDLVADEPPALGGSDAGPTPYEVVIGPSAQAELGIVLAGTAKAAVVHAPPLAAAAGAAVETLQSAGVAAEAVVVPDGEAAKTAEVAAQAWEEFGRLGLTRSDAVVGIGGGAVTDLAGFLAATWTRGVRVVQVPTSLLGMVDAALDRLARRLMAAD